jgi:hypothetical protein
VQTCLVKTAAAARGNVCIVCASARTATEGTTVQSVVIVTVGFAPEPRKTSVLRVTLASNYSNLHVLK